MPEKTSSENPYINARREWNERYGSYVSRAHTMTLIAVGCLATTVISVSGLAYIGSQSKLVPYVIETRNGDPVDIKFPNQTSQNNPLVTKAMLAGWISNIRSVSTDPVVQNKALTRVYALLQNGSSAKTFLDNYYENGGNPYERSTTETVSVEINSILSISPTTWQVEWTEEIRSLSGKKTETLRMQGAITVKYIKPSASLIYQNPIGIISENISWSQRLKG